MSKSAIEDAIAAYTGKHSDVFKDGQSIEKLKQELTYVSDSLSAMERVERAGKLAFGAYVDKTSEAYLALQEKQTNIAKGNKGSVTTKDTQNVIDELFNKRFKK